MDLRSRNFLNKLSNDIPHHGIVEKKIHPQYTYRKRTIKFFLEYFSDKNKLEELALRQDRQAVSSLGTEPLGLDLVHVKNRHQWCIITTADLELKLGNAARPARSRTPNSRKIKGTLAGRNSAFKNIHTANSSQTRKPDYRSR
ncbi:hypothetical protein EVAR_21583_1 [Eumeta japonica]|uniref:Uncharacterized protein n=1 Tax=Eumeta variegata TaxID=151549 RepID=A0A4C1UXG8_EUMVA|nr:hypothetical protein EVAR_21583_1 [Eumeta japonica]